MTVTTSGGPNAAPMDDQANSTDEKMSLLKVSATTTANADSTNTTKRAPPRPRPAIASAWLAGSPTRRIRSWPGSR